MSLGWYIVNKATIAGPARVTLYDDIEHGGASALMASIGDCREVELRINSQGGSVFEATTIYNRLTELRKVSVIVDGVAASAASVIAMAASPGCLGMAPHSRMMIHEARLGDGGPGGTATELSAMSAILDGLSDEIASVYAHRSRRPASYWRNQMRTDRWYTASEAVAEGLADYVVSADPLAAMVRQQVRACLARTYR